MDKIANSHYLSATSVDVERVFSRARLLMPHTRNRLTARSTRALMCVGNWSLAGYIHREDARKVALMPEVQAGEVDDDEWDGIDVSQVDG